MEFRSWFSELDGVIRTLTLLRPFHKTQTGIPNFETISTDGSADNWEK